MRRRVLLTVLFLIWPYFADAQFLSVTTVAESGSSHDLMKAPSAIAVVKSSGDLIVADTMHDRLLRIDVAGHVSVLAEPFKQPRGIAVDEVRRVIYLTESGNDAIRTVTFDGVAGTLTRDGLKRPSGIALDPAGVIYVADTGNSRIKRITPDGSMTTIVIDAQLKQPEGIAVAPDGALLIADTGNNAIRRWRNGVLSNVAGTGHPGYVDGSVAEFKEPSGITCDEAGSIYVADVKNDAIRQISSSGVVSTISTAFRGPQGIAFAGALYVADTGADAIRRIDATVTVRAINPQHGIETGGTEIHVFGAGFVPGLTGVRFGATPAANIAYISSTELIVTAPALPPGIFDVTVTTPGGVATLASAYATLAPPTIVGIAPRKGRSSGGDSVTITGTNFIDGAGVKFGASGAAGVIVNGGNTLTAFTPPGSGTVDVTVTTSAGSATLPTAFTYFAQPVITGFSPAQGSAGTIVTIAGTNFDPARTSVLVGSVPAPLVSASPAQLVVTIPSGATTGRITVTTIGGTATSAADFAVSNFVSLEITAPVTSFDQGDTVPFNAIARSTAGSTTDVTSQVTWTTSDGDIANVVNGRVAGRNAGTIIITATLGELSARKAITVRPLIVPVAAPANNDRTIVQSLAETIRFLYTGPDAVQTGVALDAINEDRVATITGTVHTREGAALQGVEITVANHSELGRTYTRADGRFDLAFNGGGAVTVVYRKAAWAEAQRLIASHWNQQIVLDDVVLVPYDTMTAAVTMGGAAAQTARATQVTDSDGTRTATLIFASGTSATVTAADGTISTPSSLHVRATEYTVGDSGPRAMPAPLPSMSAYTYCVELSADEASNGGIRFSKPFSFYVENFLGFPVGAQVPVGYYDRAAQRWATSRNARVIRVLAIAGDVAAIDADGDGSADSDTALAQLGITSDERKALASLYPAGQTLWRASADHFTPFDINPAFAAPGDAVGPNGRRPQAGIGATSAKCKAFGWSVIDCANQTLGETIPLQGTPYALEYDSARNGSVRYTVPIEISGNSVPASLEAIELRVTIAGRQFLQTFPPLPNQRYTFTWDGTDGFGRRVAGARKAYITVTNVFPYVYVAPRNNPSWDIPGDQILAASRRLGKYRLSQDFEVFLGHFEVAGTGFGGWTFSGQRFYDGVSRTIYDAGGVERSADPLQTGEAAVTDLIGGSSPFPDLFTMAADPDGGLYFSDGYRIKRRAADGTVTTIAGTAAGGFTPDGSSALGNPVNLWQFATGPDGTLYVIDGTRVRAIVGGRWITVAGTDVFEPGGTYALPEGVSARTRPVTAWSLAAGNDGAVYIGGRTRIYKITSDGLIYTIAGGGTQSDFIDGDAASVMDLGIVRGIAVGPHGDVYFANGTFAGRVTTDGRLFHVRNQQEPFTNPRAVDVAADGTVLVSDGGNYRVWAIAPNGATTVLAGDGNAPPSEGALATGVARSINVDPFDAKVAADGSVYLLDLRLASIRRADSAFPRPRSNAPTVVPSEGGGVAYVFEGGRHTRTVNALTGVTLETFGYDPSGFVATVTDLDGRVTTIERNTNGEATAVVAPNGQRTTLSVSGGRLRAMADAAGATDQFDYDGDGLLTKLTDRRGGLHQFTYDGNGLLIEDQDPAGGFVRLTRSGEGNTYTVSRSSAEGRTSSYSTADDGYGSSLRTQIGSHGLALTATSFGATESLSSPAANILATRTPDPRFGMMAPLGSATLSIGSRMLRLSRSRDVTLGDPKDPLSLHSITARSTINGTTWTSSYDAATRLLTSQSPLGRQSTMTLDAKGRPVVIRQPSVLDQTLSYDVRGRIRSVTAGSRVSSFTYDAFDRMETATDPLGRAVRFAYDTANRVIAKTLPDGRVVAFGYDAAGNVTSVTPPGRAPHFFTYTAVDRAESSTLPGGVSTQLRYNRDRQVVAVTRPDGSEVANSYDSAGRLTSITTNGGVFSFAYSPSIGVLESLTAPNGVATSYTYDGVVPTSIRWNGLVNGSIGINYDGDLRVTSRTIGGTAAVNYQYDADGLLTAVGMETINRDAATGRVSGTSAGVISDSRSYDEFGQLNAYTASLSGSPFLTLRYTRDAAGRVVSISETTGSSTSTRAFDYDAAGRLTSVTENGAAAASYTYDENSNRLTRTTSSGTEAGTYDGVDRVTSYGGFTFTYTPNGEIASKTSAFGTTSYRYDAFGNLVGVTLPGGHVIDYVLDGRNRRVAKKVDGVVTQKYLYGDGLRPIAQLAPDDSVVYQFLYAERANVPSLIVGHSTTYRVISDHAGSARAVLDIATGASVEYLAYDEFGNVTTDTAAGFQPFGFAGGIYDSDTHLVHFGAREYDPSLGRFLTRDPIGFGGGQANVYDYAANDPVNFVDPTGLMIGDEAGADAQQYYVDILTDPETNAGKKTLAAIGGVFASLWTPCTSDATFNVLLQAATLGLGPAPAPLLEEQSITVLGHYPAYTELAEEIGANVFSMPAEEWNALSETEQWAANRQYLDNAIERGDTFRLATPVDAAREGSYFAKELEYLTGERGLVLNEAGDSLVPGPGGL